jgi:LysM repeat protein
MKRRGGGTLGKLGLIVVCLVVSVAAAEAQTPAPGPGAPAPVGSEGTYVVKKGDTLWGIAKSLLNDPFLWPQIWERNPFITDPSRIYPGDTLAIPGREPAPAPVAEAPKPEPPKEAPKEEAKAPAPAPPAPPPAPETILAPPSPVPPASQMAIACYPVLLEEGVMEKASIGTIVKSGDSRLLISQEDYVSVGLEGEQVPKVGDRLAVVRGGRRVVHPWEKNALGRALNTLGILEVTEVRDRTVRARVIYSCEAINVGDQVAPLALAPFPEDKVAQPTTRQVEGIVVENPRALQMLGLQHVVYLNVGKSQGIGPGDVFAIYRPTAPIGSRVTGQVFPIPPERLGEAVVIRVTDSACTAVIWASAKEIRAGDWVVLSRQIQP